MKTASIITPNIDLDLNSVDITKGGDIDELSTKMALHYGVKTSEVEFFNGEEALLHSLFKYLFFIENFQGKCYIYAPCTKGFEKVLKSFSKNIELINRLENINEYVSKNALVIFTNPSTPDGKYHEIESLLAFWQERKATIIVDESLFDFYDGVSASNFIQENSDLYIVKSMEIFYHMKGVKFATLISSSKNIQRLKQYENSNKLSVFDTTYVKAVLEDRNFKRITQAIHAKNITLLEEVLRCSALFEVIHTTNTNFILAELKNMEAKELQDLLSREGVLISEFSHIKFLGNKYVGFEVYSEECIRNLIQAFQKILG